MDQERPGRGTVGRQLAAGEVARVRREVGRACGVRGDQRADRGGEREDLRGQARGRHGCALGAGGRKGGLWAAIAQEKAAEIGRLAADAARSLGCGDAGMEAAEAVIRAGMLQLGGGMLEKLLAADLATAARGCRAAGDTRPGSSPTGTRSSTPCSGRSPSPAPGITARPAATGWPPGMPGSAWQGVSMSPGLRAMNDQAAAAGPFAKAARLLENLAGVRLTAKRVERAAEASGTAAAAAVRDRARAITGRKLIPLPPSPLPDKLYAAIDGTGVPVTAKETAGRDGKGEDGRARTREVKLGVFFTQNQVDEDGYPVRDRDSSSYVATFEPAHVFAGLVEAEGIRRGAGHVRQLTILGDGAAWIWNIAAAKFPEAT